MKLEKACQIALSCELTTVEEAVLNIRLHAGSVFNYDSLSEEMEGLDKDYLECLQKHSDTGKSLKIADIFPHLVHLHYVVGDATDPQAEGKKIITHICNDRGGWGAGFVLALSKKWVTPERAYRKAYKDHQIELEKVQFVPVEDDIIVANMIAQKGYLNRSNPTPLSYDALGICLEKVAEKAIVSSASVHMPRIGCGLGGGNWDVVEAIISEKLCSKGIHVYVYDLP